VDGFDRNLHRKFGILQPIDRGQAFNMIRSLVQFLRNLNYSGLVILFDEAEQIPSLSTKQREQMLSNLREMIDECGHASFKNVMILYAIPNEAFFEGRSAVYEALKQRINSVFDFYNPTGVKIYLEKLIEEPENNLVEIGKKLYGIYAAAYQVKFPENDVARCADLIAKASYKQRFGDIGYRRLFVQGVIRGFNQMRLEGDLELSEEWANNMVAGR
ncbi:MAG: DUF2791 family P-loop domain-containing protein, partial [Deltaproteobacteria bacterium]|nr:DUF2791 family P-loop domain-containing protein [Deltaproteobacteria bacterium]